MAAVFILTCLFINQVAGYTTVSSTEVSTTPVNNITGNSALINCTSKGIENFMNIGSTFVPDIMHCTNRMADLGYDYLATLNDFYNYKYDDFRHEYQLRAKCDEGLCTDEDVRYLTSMLLRLRAQMQDMMDSIKTSSMRKTRMQCMYGVVRKLAKGATLVISCPA